MHVLSDLIRKNPHTGSLSNTDIIAFTSYDLLSTSHGHAKLLIEYWFCATKAGCTLYIVYACNLTLQETTDGGCCLPLVGKAEFANSSLPMY